MPAKFKTHTMPQGGDELPVIDAGQGLSDWQAGVQAGFAAHLGRGAEHRHDMPAGGCGGSRF